MDLVKQNEYDIVLMDLVMPGMDGIEATRFIRTQLTKPKSSVPILALTASVIRSEIDKCMEAGMNGFVPKPFKPQELLLAMYNVLNNGTSDSFREKTESGSQEVSPYSTIDLTYLNEFTEGDKERLDRFISLFLSKVPGTLETINKAVQDSDFEKVRIAAHSLKPQLRFTGIQQGLDLAEEIEHYCSGTVDMEQLMLMVTKLSEICGKAYRELEEEKNSREIA